MNGYACLYICIFFMYVCVYVSDVCMYICMYVWIYGFMNVYMYACMYVCVCMNGYVCMYVFMYVCVCVFVFVCVCFDQGGVKLVESFFTSASWSFHCPQCGWSWREQPAQVDRGVRSGTPGFELLPG